MDTCAGRQAYVAQQRMTSFVSALFVCACLHISSTIVTASVQGILVGLSLPTSLDSRFTTGE